jgi:glutathione S-transferase
MDEVVLYRCKTPTNRLCACGRVARELSRRGIEPTVERVPWRRSERGELRELTGQAVAPVLVVDGEAICDSRRIVEHLRWREDERQRASSVHRRGGSASVG